LCEREKGTCFNSLIKQARSKSGSKQTKCIYKSTFSMSSLTNR